MSDLQFFNKRKNYDKEQITVSTTSIGVTASKLNNVGAQATASSQDNAALPPNLGHRASVIIVEPLNGNVIYTLDASTPSGTNGHELKENDQLPIAGYQNSSKLRMVRDGGADVTVNVTFYKE